MTQSNLLTIMSRFDEEEEILLSRAKSIFEPLKDIYVSQQIIEVIPNTFLSKLWYKIKRMCLNDINLQMRCIPLIINYCYYSEENYVQVEVVNILHKCWYFSEYFNEERICSGPLSYVDLYFDVDPITPNAAKFLRKVNTRLRKKETP